MVSEVAQSRHEYEQRAQERNVVQSRLVEWGLAREVQSQGLAHYLARCSGERGVPGVRQFAAEVVQMYLLSSTAT